MRFACSINQALIIGLAKVFLSTKLNNLAFIVSQTAKQINKIRRQLMP